MLNLSNKEGDRDKVSNRYRNRKNALSWLSGGGSEQDVISEPTTQEAVASTGQPGSNPDVMDQDVVPGDSSAFPSFSDSYNTSGRANQSFNMDDLFSGRINIGDAPERDAAQAARLQKQAKFNTISKGLQLLFGMSVAAKGNITPGPYEDGMNQNIFNAIQQMDSRYYDELARYRDRKFRADQINLDQKNKAAMAHLEDLRWKADQARMAGDEEKARAFEREKFEFEKGIKQQGLGIQKEALKLDQDKQDKYDKQQRVQVVDSYNDAIDKAIDTYRIMQANSATEGELADQMSNIRALEKSRDIAIKKLNERELGGSPDEATPPEGSVNHEEIINKAREGGYNESPDEAFADFVSFYVSNQGKSLAEAKEKARADLEAFGITKSNKDVPESNAAAQTVKEKEGEIRRQFNEATKFLENSDLAQEMKDNFNGYPEQAINNLIDKLSDLNSFHRNGDPKIKETIKGLEDARKDLKYHQNK